MEPPNASCTMMVITVKIYMTDKFKNLALFLTPKYSVTSGVGIPTASQIRGVFGHQCNPCPILPHLYVKNIVLAQKLAKLQNF